MASSKPSPDASEPAAVIPTPAEVGESDSAGGTSDAAEVSAEQSAEPASDEVDVRDQFRQALERKRQHETDGHGGAGSNGPKLRSASGPAGAKRQFRRKSGG